MNSTVSSFEPAWSRHRWQVRDGCNIAAHAFRISHVTGWVWALNGSRRR
jgi:hypothetical protein